MPEERRLTTSRMGRLSQLGRLAGSIAGGAMAEGARQIAGGQRPAIGDMPLTPANVKRLTDRLPETRGAAMKVGQLLSMDSGQPHTEADHECEAIALKDSAVRLADHMRFDVPVVVDAPRTGQVLCMQSLDGQPIESLAKAPSVERNAVAIMLVELALLEMRARDRYTRIPPPQLLADRSRYEPPRVASVAV